MHFELKRTCLASLAFLAVSATASSAQTWTGAYLGAYAGAARGNSDFSLALDNRLGLFGAANAVSIAGGGAGSDSATGFNGGVTLGYNIQAGTIVYGVELDYGAMSLKTNVGLARTYPTNAPSGFSVGSTAETDMLFTARARLGVLAASNLLLYGTAGLAMTELKVQTQFTENFFAPNATGSASSSDLKTAFVFGGGAEYALTRNWSLKAEYLYANFGSVDLAGRISTAQFPANPVPFVSSGDLAVHSIRAGINYKF